MNNGIEQVATIVTAETVAEFKDVSKSYGYVRAIDDLTIEIRRGETVALLGPNGAGKTTTLGLLLGLLSPSSGSISVFGVRPGTQRAKARTGAMLQVSGLPPSLSVGEQLRLFSSYYPSPLPVAETVHAAGLQTLQQRRYGRLSTGQQQKVHYGISICGNPELLILDEPTASLDIESRRHLWNDLKERASTERALILATHNLEEAETLADRIILLAEGRVIADASPTEIKSQVAGKTIVVTTTLSDSDLDDLQGVLGWRREVDQVHLFVDEAAAALRCLLAADAGIRDIEVQSADLEDAFVFLLSGKNEAA